MALVRTITQVPGTFEDLAMTLNSFPPKGFKRIDLVADSYLQNSIKDAERANRGQSSRIILKSALSKIPREFSKFLSNRENKTRMIELIFETLQRKKAAVLNTLRTTKIILSREDHCQSISLSSNDTFGNLLSNHEEADTKSIAHAMQFVEENENHRVIIRSPSGDTEILVLTVSVLYNHKTILIDNSSGKEQKSVWLGALELSQQRSKSLLRLQAFSKNDYVPSFFKKGKNQFWKLLEKFEKFHDCSSNLGIQYEMSEELFKQLEEFVTSTE